MSDTPRSERDSIPPTSDAVDGACYRFEAAWLAALDGGTRPRIEDHLAPVPQTHRAAVLRELVLLGPARPAPV